MAGTERTINNWLFKIRRKEFKYRWPWNNQFNSNKEYIWYEYYYYRNKNQSDKVYLARAIVDDDENPILILINEGKSVNASHIDIMERLARQHNVPSVKVPFDIMEYMPCYINYSEYFDGRYERPERPG